MSIRTSSGNSRRILASVGVIGALGILGGVGTYSAWSSQVTAGPQTVSSATLNLTKQADTVSATIGDLVPGDTVDRIITIKNSGSSNFGSIDFSSIGSGDLAGGLKLTVDACASAWAGSPLACSPASTSVLGEGSLTRSVNLTNLTALTAGASSYLRVRIALPSDAANSLQGTSATVNYTITGNQIAGTAK